MVGGGHSPSRAALGEPTLHSKQCEMKLKVLLSGWVTRQTVTTFSHINILARLTGPTLRAAGHLEFILTLKPSVVAKIIIKEDKMKFKERKQEKE